MARVGQYRRAAGTPALPAWVVLCVLWFCLVLPVSGAGPETNATRNARAPILVPAPAGASNAAPRMPLQGELQRPVEIPDPWRRVWPVAFVILVAGAAVVAWWRWTRRVPAVRPPEPLPDPATVARSRIEAARGLMNDPRAYAAEVSDAVRQYLEARFGLRAPEQTTEEFLVGLSRRPLLDVRHQGPLIGFLEQCDLVKFAGWRPGAQELDGLEAAAVWVVDETAATGPWKTPPVQPPGTGGDHAV